MSIFNDKSLKGVADVALKIMEAELSSKQKAIAKISEPKEKIDAGDLAKLRAGHKPVKEDAGASKEKETKFHSKLDKLVHKTFGKSPTEMKKEEVEEVDESVFDYKSAGTRKVTGATTRTGHDVVKRASGTVYTKRAREDEPESAEPKSRKKQKVGSSSDLMSDEEFRKKHGMSRKNYERMQAGTKIGESFTGLLEQYSKYGLKSIAQMRINEEPDNEQFTKELEGQKKKASEKKTPEDEARVAKPFVQAVKMEEVEKKPPFEGPYKKVQTPVKDKSGAVHGPMSRVRHLAKQAMMKKTQKEEVELDEAAKWRQGYAASGHPAGYKHKSGEVGPLGGTYTYERDYDDDRKVPVQKHRDQSDPLANREKTKLSTSGKPLVPKNAAKNLKTAITAARGKHGPVSRLPEEAEELDELNKSTLGSYIKKASHDVAGKSSASRQFTIDALRAKTNDNYVDARKKERMANKAFDKSWNRRKGISKAVDRMTKEEVGMAEAVTDYNPPSQGGTRKELLARLAKSKDPKHAESARKAGASQDELRKAMKERNTPVKEEYEVFDADEINGMRIDNIEERKLSEPEMKKREKYVKGMKKKLSGFKSRYGDRAKEVMYATATRMAKEGAEPKVTVLPPVPTPKNSWGKGMSKSRFAKGDGPQVSRKDTSDASYTDRRMRDAENRGTGDIQNARKSFRETR